MHPTFIKKALERGLSCFRRDVFSGHQIRLIKRLLFLLVPYALLRLGFYFYHLNIYKQFSQEDIFESFFWGVRFDISAIILVNLITIILSFIPSFNKKFLFIDRTIFILVNTAFFIVAINDYELFLFTGKRLSFDFFVITSDIADQLPQVALHYWYFPLISIFSGIGFYFFDKNLNSVKKNNSKRFSFIASVFFLGLCFLGIRGGLQHKSINIQSAFIQGKNELGHLVLNTPYHFIRTLKNKPLKRLKYFSTDDEAMSIILSKRDLGVSYRGIKNANVVLIILESFSVEYLEKGYAPFLNELTKSGVIFTRHLANGRRSIESLPSLLCGLPSLLNEPISKSIYSSNKFSCFPEVLKNAGYTNYFFHAGARGTMGFDSYSLASGFEKYFSRDDYGKNDFDGTWGVFDLPYLQYVAGNLTQTKEPFLATIFTLSSHQPYKIPDEFKDKFPKGKLEIHESIGYTDHSLKKFFETAVKSKWYKNTIFIITSDHTQILETRKHLNLVGHYRVPLIMLIPNTEARAISKVTQHSDIPKTILDLVEVDADMPMTSVSTFSRDSGMAINYSDGSSYFLVSEDRVYTLEDEFRYDWETGELSKLGENKDLTLKAYLQYFTNGLINNNLSIFR